MTDEIPSYWQAEVPAANLTSMKVGGLVTYLAKPRNVEQLAETYRKAEQLQFPVKILGGGSNLILPDGGLKVVLIQPFMQEARVLTAEEAAQFTGDEYQPVAPEARYRSQEDARFLHLQESEVANQEGEWAWVEMEAGVPWGKAVMWSLQQGLTGLHWYARIPCAVGGAVYNNIHGEKHFLSEVIAAVKAWDPQTRQSITYKPGELDFGYDHSLFHENKQVITSVIFRLQKPAPEAVAACKDQYLEWTKQKSVVQPSGANCGSVFKNLSAEQAASIGQQAVAAAWYIDQTGFKGVSEGGMQVYPGHANFIINTGTGTQSDFRRLVNRIRQAVKEKFSIVLEPEAECIDEQGRGIIWE